MFSLKADSVGELLIFLGTRFHNLGPVYSESVFPICSCNQGILSVILKVTERTDRFPSNSIQRSFDLHSKFSWEYYSRVSVTPLCILLNERVTFSSCVGRSILNFFHVF